MTAVLSKPVMSYETAPTSVLYDIFYEAGTRLGAAYITLERRARKAGNTVKADEYRKQQIALDMERAAVDPHDRASLIRHMEDWNRLSAELMR